jgi:pimeloyl-ACP methyl ester carboxylesterase
VNRPALVLLPGLMCDQGVWVLLRQALHERSIEFHTAEYGLADSLTDMARAVLLGSPGPLIVIGHSMGGRVAWEIARQAGERLRGAALLDTGYRALDSGEAGEREMAGRLRLLEQAEAQGVRAMALSWVQGMVHPDRLAERALIDPILDMFERHSVAQFAAQIRALLRRADATPVLRDMKCPTLLLCGEQDQWATPAQHREMAALIAGSLLTLIPRCGHMSSLEQPEAVNAALLGWLERIGPFSP